MKKGYQSEYEKLGKSLLEGKTISEITLKGKKYKFSYTTEEFIETARASKWPEELIILGKKYSLEDIAREYKDVQSKYISDFTSDFCLNSGGFGCSA